MGGTSQSKGPHKIQREGHSVYVRCWVCRPIDIPPYIRKLRSGGGRYGQRFPPCLVKGNLEIRRDTVCAEAFLIGTDFARFFTFLGCRIPFSGEFKIMCARVLPSAQVTGNLVLGLVDGRIDQIARLFSQVLAAGQTGHAVGRCAGCVGVLAEVRRSEERRVGKECRL